MSELMQHRSLESSRRNDKVGVVDHAFSIKSVQWIWWADLPVPIRVTGEMLLNGNLRIPCTGTMSNDLPSPSSPPEIMGRADFQGGSPSRLDVHIDVRLGDRIERYLLGPWDDLTIAFFSRHWTSTAQQKCPVRLIL